jgi:hypothetical protein
MSANLNTSAKTKTTAGAALFPLGRILITPAAQEAIREAGQLPLEFLLRHQSGDWGDLCSEDKRENEFSIANGFLILSKYHTTGGEPLYVITEWDRSVTTILLPSEY